jgi:hypothetical protein
MTIFKKGDIRQFAKFLDCECQGTTTLYSTRAPKEQETKEVVVEPQKIKAVTDAESDLLKGYDLHLLNKEQLITLIKSLLKEAEAIMREAELGEVSEEDFDVLPYNKVISQKTRLNDRIVPNTSDKERRSSKSNQSEPEKGEEIPFLVAAEAKMETSLEKPTEKPPKSNSAPKKKYTKTERALLKRFSKV